MKKTSRVCCAFAIAGGLIGGTAAYYLAEHHNATAPRQDSIISSRPKNPVLIGKLIGALRR